MELRGIKSVKRSHTIELSKSSFFSSICLEITSHDGPKMPVPPGKKSNVRCRLGGRRSYRNTSLPSSHFNKENKITAEKSKGEPFNHYKKWLTWAPKDLPQSLIYHACEQ